MGLSKSRLAVLAAASALVFTMPGAYGAATRIWNADIFRYDAAAGKHTDLKSAAVGSNLALTLPGTTGASGDVVQSDGAGNMSFVTPVKADATHNGFLGSTDWSTFNGKAASGANADITSLAHITKLYPAADGVTAVQFDMADGATNVMSLDTTHQRVGIGTATPSYQLVVDGGTGSPAAGYGVIEIDDNYPTNGPQLRLNNHNTGHNWLFYNSTSTDPAPGGLYIYDGGNPRTVIDASGNYGIGNSAPASKLDVNGGIRMSTATTRPACVSGIRGTLWAVAAAGGVTDTLAICLKSAADTYSWVQIITGG